MNVSPPTPVRKRTESGHWIRLPFDDFGEYLVAQPNVPTEFPQHLGNFLTRVTLVDESRAIGAVVTQVFDGVVTPSHLTVILDIEVSKPVEMSPVDVCFLYH
jgi:hypothetical protein